MSSPDYEQAAQGNLRYRYRPLDADAFAQYMSLAPVIPMGHFELTVGTTAVGLPSIPQYSRRAVIVSRTTDLTYTDDGTDPSVTHGIVIPRNAVFTYDTYPNANFKMWCPTPSDVRIAYYG